MATQVIGEDEVWGDSQSCLPFLLGLWSGGTSSSSPPSQALCPFWSTPRASSLAS